MTNFQKFFRNTKTQAFTLVEVLVVIVILSMMGGMIVVAVQGAVTASRESRTRYIISAIDNVLQEQYESYKYRPLAVEVPNLFQTQPSAPANQIGYEVLSTEAARVRLMMIRDLQRMEMPDRLTDISAGPFAMRAAANPVVENATTGEIVSSRNDKSLRRMFPVTWFGGGPTNIPNKLRAYRDRLPPSPSATNQGAECLYLIMATSFIGGAPAINVIPSSNIGDTDGDGLLEILDGWGRPLGFVRWPVGYADPYRTVDTTVPDEFDLFRSDFAYQVSGGSPALATDVVSGTTRAPWSIRPLVVSAGDDGIFGIALNPHAPQGVELSGFSYRDPSWNWPADNAWCGMEAPGRNSGISSPHPYPDPYLRQFIVESSPDTPPSLDDFLLPGQQLPETVNSSAGVGRSDNITNYSLQVEQ